MTISNKIKYIDSPLLICPNCGNNLDVNSEFGDDPTTCQCGYTELAGSSLLATKTANYLTTYTKDLGYDSFFFKDGELPCRFALDSTGYLPILATRAASLQISTNIYGLPSLNLGLGLVADSKACIGQRVVFDNENFNLATTLCFLVETIHEAIELTKSLGKDKFSNRQICLDYTTDIVLDSNIDNETKLAVSKSHIPFR